MHKCITCFTILYIIRYVIHYAIRIASYTCTNIIHIRLCITLYHALCIILFILPVMHARTYSTLHYTSYYTLCYTLCNPYCQLCMYECRIRYNIHNCTYRQLCMLQWFEQSIIQLCINIVNCTYTCYNDLSNWWESSQIL